MKMLPPTMMHPALRYIPCGVHTTIIIFRGGDGQLAFWQTKKSPGGERRGSLSGGVQPCSYKRGKAHG